MRRKLDAAFMRPEERWRDLRYKTVRTDPLVFVFPSKHRLASRKEVAPQDIVNEPFCLPSKSAPAVRRTVLEYLGRAGVDLKPQYEVHNVVHAISMITSTQAVMLLPAYTNIICRTRSQSGRSRERYPRWIWSSRTTRRTSLRF